MFDEPQARRPGRPKSLAPVREQAEARFPSVAATRSCAVQPPRGLAGRLAHDGLSRAFAGPETGISLNEAFHSSLDGRSVRSRRHRPPSPPPPTLSDTTQVERRRRHRHPPARHRRRDAGRARHRQPDHRTGAAPMFATDILSDVPGLSVYRAQARSAASPQVRMRGATPGQDPGAGGRRAGQRSRPQPNGRVSTSRASSWRDVSRASRF